MLSFHAKKTSPRCRTGVPATGRESPIWGSLVRIMHGEVKNGKLILTIDLSEPFVSKFATAKAIKDKVDPNTLSANMRATAGGFTLCL